MSRVALLATVLVLVVSAPAQAGWTEPLGSRSTLHVDPTLEAAGSDVLMIGGAMHAAWTEETTSAFPVVRVARLDPATGEWSHLGGAVTFPGGNRADGVSLADVGGVPWVAFTQRYVGGTDFDVVVARWDGAAWQQVGTAADRVDANDARGVDIAVVAGVPHLVWNEADDATYELRVARLDGGDWLELDGGDPTPLNRAPNSDAGFGAIADVGGVPHVVWNEYVDGTVRRGLHGSRWTGTAWEALGGRINPIGEEVQFLAIAAVAGAPWIAWYRNSGPSSGDVYVHRYDAGLGNWVQVATIDQPPGTLGAALVNASGDAPYVAWTGTSPEGGRVVRVARIRGGTFELVPRAASADPAMQSWYPALAVSGGVPWVSWSEHPPLGARQLHVKRLEPELVAASESAGPSDATLTAQLETVGIDATAAFVADGAEQPGRPLAATLTHELTGLEPATDHGWRLDLVTPAARIGLVPQRAYRTADAPPLPEPPPPGEPSPGPPPITQSLPGRIPAQTATATFRPSPPPAPPEQPPRPGSARAAALSGAVLITLPGGGDATLRNAFGDLPRGTRIDARRGKVVLLAGRGKAHRSVGVFSGGRFGVARVTAERLTLALDGRCGARKRLLADADRGFVVRTRHADTSAVGSARWTVTERCGATTLRVMRGIVALRADGRARRVRAGQRITTNGDT